MVVYKNKTKDLYIQIFLLFLLLKVNNAAPCTNLTDANAHFA